MDGHAIEASDFLAALFEGSSDGLCLVAPDGTVLRANQAWLRSTGLFSEQVVGADILELFPETRELARDLHARARRGERVKVPVHHQAILGRDTWWDGSLAPVPMEGGTGLLITARELVRGPAAEEVDRARLAGLEARSNEIELVVRLDGRLALVNDRAVECYGYSRAELVGMDVRRLRPADASEHVARQLAAAAHEGIRFEAVHVRKDGSHFPVEVSSRAIEAGGERYLHSIVRDLTERRRAEEAAREAAARLEVALAERDLVLQHSPLAVGRALGRQTVWCNQRMADLFGYELREVLGIDSRLFHLDDESYRRAGEEAARGLAAAGQYVTEARLRRKDGSPFWARINTRLTGTPGELITFLEDVTARHEAEQALAESEGRLARAFDGSLDGFFDLDLATGVSTRSDRFARLLGLDPAALPPTLEGFFRAVHPEDLPALRAAIGDLLAGRSEALDHTFRARHADGTERWFRSRGRVLVREGGAPGHFAGSITEVTSQVRAEAALREALARNEALVAELRESLARVRTLSGLLPICMHCHKVRNDQGYWDRIEQYLADHTGAEVSHGLCPACLEQHYPGRGQA